ncbi:protein FAR-RED IMPAIRED RESPONSE 1-like [Prunus avium]|uniref:Protein FAR1-RELATED SEQUENCE n=1 Tax=Prunus avium TaxID=42229 RepID=A0A6P5RXB4_PRUAV|nr:protein FAR-RED IMPAIRED RESPONSE 1-like [Prunus avium]
MPLRMSKIIITDQDPAMTKAISEALPNTFHRYCSWHILNKFSDKPECILHYQQFRECVWDSESRDEFDLRWKRIVEDSGLNEDTWLQSIFNIRSKWVPAYVNHIFSCGMSSSQRAESGHAFFKRYVSKNNSLVDFMVQFNRGLLHQRHLELMADHTDINEKAKTKCPIMMDRQMANIYTRTYFYKFQDQLWESYCNNVELIEENATHCTYKVVHMDDKKKKRNRLIVYDKYADFASCSCHMFESLGIPCSHTLAYLHKIRQLHELPDQYILKRWTRSARSDLVVDNDGVVISVDKSLIGKRSALFQRYSNVIDKVILSDEASQIFCEALDSLIERIKPLLHGAEEVLPSARRSIAFEACINEPDPVKAKGSGKRLKGRKELAREKYKGRRCNGCGKYGQTHDKRNCPMLQKSSSNVEKDAFNGMDNSSSSQDDEFFG